MTEATDTTRLALSRYDEQFLACSWNWLNDPVVKQLTMTPDFTREGQERWFHSLGSKTDYAIFGVSAGERRIGACGLKNITADAAEYWGYIGEAAFWGQGLGALMLAAMVDEARKRGLERLWLKVSEDNLRAIRLYQKAGFTELEADNGVQVMTLDLAASTSEQDLCGT